MNLYMAPRHCHKTLLFVSTCFLSFIYIYIHFSFFIDVVLLLNFTLVSHICTLHSTTVAVIYRSRLVSFFPPSFPRLLFCFPRPLFSVPVCFPFLLFFIYHDYNLLRLVKIFSRASLGASTLSCIIPPNL